MREVFAAAAASTELGQSFFQELAHVVRLAGGLGEDQRGLRRVGGEQSDCGGLTREFLRQQLDKIKLAIGKSPHDQFASIVLGRFGQQRISLRRSQFVLRVLALFP